MLAQKRLVPWSWLYHEIVYLSSTKITHLPSLQALFVGINNHFLLSLRLSHVAELDSPSGQEGFSMHRSG